MTNNGVRYVRLAFAGALGVATAVVVGAAAIGTTASRTPLFATLLEDTTLYRLGIPAVAAELDDSDIVARLRTGPLELTATDIHRILDARFSPEDVALKAREVHAGLVRYVRAYPRDSIFRIAIRRERPLLVPAARERILARYRALPDCDFSTDLGLLGRAGAWKLFGDGAGIGFLESLPSCFPPGPVATPVMDGIRAEMGRMLRSGADSADAFPDPGRVDWPTYSRLIGRIQRVDRYLTAAPWAVFLGGGVLLLALGIGGPRIPILPGAWLYIGAVGLALFGLGLGLRHPDLPQLLLTLFGGEPGAGSRNQRLWLELAGYGIHRVLLFVSGTVLVTGAAAAVGGMAGRWAGGGPSR